MRNRLSRLEVVGFGVLAIAIAGLAATLVSKLTGPRQTPASSTKFGSGVLSSGPEVILIYVGGSTCTASFLPGFAESVQQLKLKTKRQAHGDKKQFHTIGIAVDWSIPKGITYLAKYGEFDEISVGRNWANSLALKYFFMDHPGPADIPQIIILERALRVNDTNVGIEGERVIVRITGADEIKRYVEAIPKFAAVGDR